jgi:tetratricopeptide (TPR) repeat protein
MQKVTEKLWADGRVYFEKALNLDKNYLRSKQCLSLAYNNEGMASEDKELAIKLLQKAHDYEPDDPIVRTNLARAFNDKAVAIVTPANQSNKKELDRALGLLRAAALTVKPDVSAKELDAFIAGGGAGADEFKKLPEGLYRTVLENIAFVARVRKQLGR